MFLAFLVGILYFQSEFGSSPQRQWFSAEGLRLALIVVVMILPIPVHVMGLVVGLVALFLPNRKRLFPFLAIVLNSLFGLCSLIPWAWLALHSPGVK